MTVLLPRAGAPIAEAGGQPTREHFQWCARITEAVNAVATPVAVEEAAPADPSLPINTLALGLRSVRHFGSLADGRVLFDLEGDVIAPGINYVYGTDAAGVRGWRELASTTNLNEGTNLYHTAARVLATVLTGLSTASATVITAADSVLVALGNLQAQISANLATLTGHTGSTANPHSVTAAQVGADPSGTAAALLTATITNGDTTHAPSGDAVFDALAGKRDDVALAVIAGLSADQTLANATTTKVNLNTESLDTHGCFDTATGRFTATQAGLYQAVSTLALGGAGAVAGQRIISYVYKNGVVDTTVTGSTHASTTNVLQAVALVQMNATDYLEMYARRDTTATYDIIALNTRFSAIRVSA